LQLQIHDKKNIPDTIAIIRKFTYSTKYSVTGDIANSKVSTHLATAISCDNPFVMPALEQFQAAIVDDKSPTKQVLDREDYEPQTRRRMLQCKQHVQWGKLSKMN
jgi:hypothetical protein